MAGRDSKRRKISHPWLDLEAQVALEDEDGEDVWEIDDEMLIEEPTPADSLVSHAQLRLELDRAHEVHAGEWPSFLERLSTRAPPTPPSSTSQEEVRTFVGSIPVWKVPVKAGWEEIVTFRILEKQSTRKGAASPILSVIGRASCPGFILVETQFASDIHSLSPGIENIYPKKATTMPPEGVLDCLRGQTAIWTPQAPGWVRLSSFPYRGDLAFISRVDPRTLVADLAVVPRIDYTHPEDSKPSRSRAPPPQAFFNAPAIRALFGEEKVEKRNHIFLFDGKFYRDGFLETDSSEAAIIPKNATPTPEELYWFHQSPAVPARWLDAAFDSNKRRAVQFGDKVKVLVGDYKGAVATVMGALNNEAVQLEISTSLLAPKVIIEMAAVEIRQSVSVGDEVVVNAGPHKNASGWVIVVEGGNIQIFNDKTFQQINVPLLFVDFQSADFILGIAPTAPPLASFVDQDLLNVNITDPHRHLIGRHVRIVGKNHYKAYRGIVKETLQNDFLIVELAANMKRHRVRMSNLALSNSEGGKIRPITGKTLDTEGKAPAPRKPPHIPPSVRPLVPSTPLPPALTGMVSPAWDPASRTPLAGPSTHRLSWMLSPFLSDKRFKIVLVNTKPLLRDPGFKSGEHEGKNALWSGIDDTGNAKITLGFLKLSVPLKYVDTIRPSMKSQTAAATQGPFAGGEYTIVQAGPRTCLVKPRKGGGGNIEIDTELLAVIT